MYDIDIVKMVKMGEIEAFERLYLDCAPKVFALCQRICCDEKAAYNALANTMLEIWDSFDFDLDMCFDEWLYYCAQEKAALYQVVLGKSDYSFSGCWRYILSIIKDNKVSYLDEEEWTPIFFEPEDDEIIMNKNKTNNPAMNLFRIINQNERLRQKKSESI